MYDYELLECMMYDIYLVSLVLIVDVKKIADFKMRASSILGCSGCRHSLIEIFHTYHKIYDYSSCAHDSLCDNKHLDITKVLKG